MKRFTAILLAILVALALVLPLSSFATPPAAPPPPGDRVDLDAPAVPGQFVIKFKPGIRGSQRAATAQAQGGRFFARIPALDADAVEFLVVLHQK